MIIARCSWALFLTGVILEGCAFVTRPPFVEKERESSILCLPLDGDNASDSRKYCILQRFGSCQICKEHGNLPRILVELGAYPSLSMAKRACNHQKVIIIRSQTQRHLGAKGTEPWILVDPLLSEKLGVARNESIAILGQASSLVFDLDDILIQTRSVDCFYPMSVTKYVYPPAGGHQATVVFEDDCLAIVNKPENLTTIGEHRQDLLALLPFLLRPSSSEPSRIPRPVHRLDRRTSGLVLVAKTKAAMKELSLHFADRKVQKTYVAIVYGNSTNVPPDAPTGWEKIDYPIGGKAAITYYRILETVSYRNTTLSLIEAQPRTGRNHQIRRHLSYCLGLPIVGDAKYDNGARFLRTDGMFLCSTGLLFPYTKQGKTTIHTSSEQCYDTIDNDGISMLKVTVAMPQKFRDFMSRGT